MSKKDKKQETLPFDAQQLGNMTDTEFYLMVVGYEKKEQMDKEMAQRGKVPQKARDAFNAIDGLLGEVISRTPHSCEFYQLGELSKVLLADGTPLGKQIDKVFQLYIFRMESVQMQDSQPPILTGSAQPYDLHCNRVSVPLEQKVTVYMAQTPTQKTKSGLMCL